MLTVKLVKYDTSPDNQPTHTTDVTLRECTAVHMKFEADGRQVAVQCGLRHELRWKDHRSLARILIRSNGWLVYESAGVRWSKLREWSG